MGSEDGRTRSNCWSHIEEVFLVGAVMERWWTRGSLAAARIGNVNNDSCWDEIKENYDNNWQKLENKSRPAERSANALSRHFKVMKTRISTPSGEEGDSSKSFEAFYLEWETKYNRESSLMLNTIYNMIKQGKLFPEYTLVKKTDDRKAAQGRKKRVYSSTHAPDSFEHNEYYNTVHGSNGVIMARQLKQELNLFNRHPHQISHDGHGQQQSRNDQSSQILGGGLFHNGGGVGNPGNHVEERKLEFPNVDHLNDEMDVQIVSGLFDMFGIEGNNANQNHGQSSQNHGQNTATTTNNGKYQEPYKTEPDEFAHHVGNVTGTIRTVRQQRHVNGVAHSRNHGRNGLGIGNGLPPLHGRVSQKDDAYLHTVSGADAAKMAQQLQYEREHHRRSTEVARIQRSSSKRRLVDPNPTTVFDHFQNCSVENEFVNPISSNGDHKRNSLHYGTPPIESKGKGESFHEKEQHAFPYSSNVVDPHGNKEIQSPNNKLATHNNSAPSQKKQGSRLNMFFGRRNKPERNKR